MKESELGSIRTFLGLLEEEEFTDSDSVYLFRGHADKNFELLPSIYRKHQWFSNEDKMIREIIMRCPSEFDSMSSSFEKLVKMQHYDLPTRLLDVTLNPLVALYFACLTEENTNSDGEIVFFKLPRSEIKYFDSDTVSIISNLALAKSDFEIADRYSNSPEEFHNNHNHHALKLIHDIRQEKPHFVERINPNHIKSVVFVKPKMDNPRLVRQQGAFLLFGIGNNKHIPAIIPNNWILNPKNKRYVIKHQNKKKLFKQLSTLGISKATLFPEIDMVSQFIKNDYGLEPVDFESSVVSTVLSRPKITYGW